MIQPIRPNDATGVYRRQVSSADAATQGLRGGGGAARRAGRASDQVSISDQAQALRRVLSAVRELPDVSEARIEHIRQQLGDGSYDMDIAAIAERLLDEGLAS